MSSLATKQKRKHIKPKGQKVKLFRANDPLVSVLMWGVNHSISQLRYVSIPVMLMSDDFKAYSKIRVDNHLFNKENMPSHFKFKEYCPIVFRNLRERFGLDEEVFANSLTKEAPHDADSPGRSGARFLLTSDRRFLIKTISSEDVAQMHHILKEYHQHIVEKHGKTLLPQYLGMYRLTVNDQETYMLIMRNIFSPRLKVHRKYDLKGSTVARQASDKEKSKDLPTYKDNDFLTDGSLINIGPEAKVRMLTTLQADVDFLVSQNLMDYSLLVGIHDPDRAEREQNESFDNEENGIDEEEDSGSGGEAEGGIPTPPDSPVCAPFQPLFTGELDPEYELFAIKGNESDERNLIYFMALIDILTHYGMKKRTAQAAKTVKHGAGAEISTVKPDQYAKRFVDFVTKSLQ